MSETTHTIAVCNYNMTETIGRAIDSMLSLVDERFEVLVVDDGSTDDSVAVVRERQSVHNNLRLVELPKDPNRKLGETRNVSVREADGEYVLLQLDADDIYETGIVDFVEIYHQLKDRLDFEFYLKGNNINMASKQFLLKMGPYRNLPVGGEDLDFWRRLFARDAVVWFDHDDISHEIGDSGGLKSRVWRSFRVRVAEFQTGISFPSFLRYGTSLSPLQLCKYLVVCPPAYLLALTRERYELAAEFRQKGTLVEQIEGKRQTLSEIEQSYEITIDRAQLSDAGMAVFDDEKSR